MNTERKKKKNRLSRDARLEFFFFNILFLGVGFKRKKDMEQNGFDSLCDNYYSKDSLVKNLTSLNF